MLFRSGAVIGDFGALFGVGTLLGKLTLPGAGNYVVTAKLNLQSESAVATSYQLSCSLYTGAQVTAGGFANFIDDGLIYAARDVGFNFGATQITLTGVVQLTGVDEIQVRCADGGPTHPTSWSYLKITAIQVNDVQIQ